MRGGAALLAFPVALLLAACGGGGGQEADGLLADRIMRLGEERSAVVETLRGELPSGLSKALNPDATAETLESELIALAVHPQGELIGSSRIGRPDGVIAFFIFYDIPGDGRAVELALLRQLDETPWQVVQGQSTSSQSTILFESTFSADIEGTVIIRPVLDAEDGPLTSVIYVLEVRPPKLVEEPEFELPEARPVPESFPGFFLLLEGMTPITVLWSSAPTGDSYQLVLLTRESAFDVTEEYRERLEAEGWELVDDRAIGFATTLDFQNDGGDIQGTLTADAFARDSSYTSVLLELQTFPRSGN